MLSYQKNDFGILLDIRVKTKNHDFSILKSIWDFRFGHF
jgi:hypothetical protein